jgi:hypothetical protein
MYKVKHIKPMSLAKVLLVLQAVGGIFTGFFILISAAFDEAIGVGIGLVMFVLSPLLSALFGFLFGLMMAWLYNVVVAKNFGGIEVEIEKPA